MYYVDAITDILIKICGYIIIWRLLKHMRYEIGRMRI